MFPEIAKKNLILLPKNRQDPYYEKYINEAVEDGIGKERAEKEVDYLLLLQDERERVLKSMGINEEMNGVFLYFYLHGCEDPKANRVEKLDGLVDIFDDYKQPFWGDEYPGIEQRYLRISSIEGEGSLFYDKETDAVYDVGWHEMDGMLAGDIEPKFTSFYDFLEWYYGDEDE